MKVIAKKWLGWLTILTLLVSILGCGTSGSSPSKDQSNAKEPIKVGALLSETGPAAWIGDPQLKAIKLAVEEINAAGGINGRPIDLISYNDEGSPEKAVMGAKKLIEQDKVAVILGASLVATSKAIAPLVKEKGPIAFSLSGGYVSEHRYMFAAGVHTEHMQQTIMDWFKANGLKKVALLSTTDATGQVAVDGINKVAPLAGVEIVAVERMNASDIDVTAQLTKIRSAKPDAVIGWLTGKPSGVLVKNFSQLGLTMPLFISHGNLSYSFVDSIKTFQPKTVLLPSPKDLVWQDLPESDPQRKINEVFHKKYEEVYKVKADVIATMAYDSTKIVAVSMIKVGTDPNKMVEAIEGLTNHVGLGGIYNFSKTDHRGTARKDAVLVQIKDGKFSLFWR